jgi:saccharopine dehydrogenase-like NADP-dependent oxidoreductase
MHHVLVLGAGKIGSLIACLLEQSGDYDIYLADMHSPEKEMFAGIHTVALDATDESEMRKFLNNNKFESVVSALPYYCNPLIAQLAKDNEMHYFDLTEDVEVTRRIRAISQHATTAFVPQCGLAPGFISIVANDLMQKFDELDTVKMRVGALPVNPSNVLKYSLTWSTDGLINEYGNMCQAIENGELTDVMPLEGYETITIDGLLYEAFNTSGGLGSLAETYANKIHKLNYKTMRYPGHCEKIHLLMNELKLNEDRKTLKYILENAIPKTLQDVVLIYVSVTGMKQGQFFEENYVQKVYPQTIADKLWSAIQVTTAAGLCSVLDLVLQTPELYQGYVKQEAFTLGAVLENRFGKYFAPK